MVLGLLWNFFFKLTPIKNTEVLWDLWGLAVSRTYLSPNFFKPPTHPPTLKAYNFLPTQLQKKIRPVPFVSGWTQSIPAMPKEFYYFTPLGKSRENRQNTGSTSRAQVPVPLLEFIYFYIQALYPGFYINYPG